MNIDFKIIEYGSQDWKDAVKLREDVLRKPMGQTFSEQELDEEKFHLQVAGFDKGRLIATAVLVPETAKLKMQRVAVLEDLRNLNVGSAMMAFCEEYAVTNGYKIVYCHARDTAVNFYLRNGYQPEGDYFEEDGIPHLKMSKMIVLNG